MGTTLRGKKNFKKGAENPPEGGGGTRVNANFISVPVRPPSVTPRGKVGGIFWGEKRRLSEEKRESLLFGGGCYHHTIIDQAFFPYALPRRREIVSSTQGGKKGRSKKKKKSLVRKPTVLGNGFGTRRRLREGIPKIKYLTSFLLCSFPSPPPPVPGKAKMGTAGDQK